MFNQCNIYYATELLKIKKKSYRYVCFFVLLNVLLLTQKSNIDTKHQLDFSNYQYVVQYGSRIYVLSIAGLWCLIQILILRESYQRVTYCALNKLQGTKYLDNFNEAHLRKVDIKTFSTWLIPVFLTLQENSCQVITSVKWNE